MTISFLFNSQGAARCEVTFGLLNVGAGAREGSPVTVASISNSTRHLLSSTLRVMQTN